MNHIPKKVKGTFVKAVGGLALAVGVLWTRPACAAPAIEGSGTWSETKTTLTIETGDWTITGALEDYSTICVNAGARLAVGVDNPFGTRNPTLAVFGTWDLCGHSVSIAKLDNHVAKTDFQTNGLPRVCNSSATAVTLSCTGASDFTYYYGEIREMPGKINLVFANTARLIGPDGSSAVSSVTLNGGTMLEHSQPARVRFNFKAREGLSLLMRLAEITLTYKGAPLPVTPSIAAVSSEMSGSLSTNLVDGSADTYWRATDAGDQWVELGLGSSGVPVDGYRLTPAPKEGANDYNPVGWDVYVYRADECGWMPVDSQRNVAWPRALGEGKRPHATANYPFQPTAPGSAFGADTALTLNSSSSPAALRVSTRDPLVVGSVAGVGAIRLENSGLVASSFDGYTGDILTTVASYRQFSTLGLLGGEGAAAEVRVPNLQCATNLLVVNGGTAPVSVKLDDSETTHLFGTLADGTAGGTLGLVKTGVGERVVETEAADYTGATEVREGTLVVSAKRAQSCVPFTAQYVQIVPLRVSGGAKYNDNYDFNWAIGRFQLLNAEGQTVDMSGASVSTVVGFSNDSLAKTALIGTQSRCLVKQTAGGDGTLHPVTLTFTKPVTFAGYTWSPDQDGKASASRNPITLAVSVSDDGTNWRCVSAETQEHTVLWATEKMVARGPYAARIDQDAQRTDARRKTLDAAYLQGVGSRASRGALKSRKFRFRVFGTTNPEGHVDGYGWFLAEIGLLKDGQRVNWPEGTKVTLVGGTLNKNNNSKLEGLVDNVVWEAGEGNDLATRNGAFVENYPSAVVIEAPSELAFDSYSLTSTSTADYYVARLPSAWDFSVGDGTTWYQLDAKGDYRNGIDYTITKAYQEIGPFEVASRYPLGDRGCCDALGDRSPVTIAAGATLALRTDFERIGPLAGAGTLDLDYGAVAEINACAPATFAGRVTGTGARSTLVVSGTDVQTFGNADLHGVATLELEGAVAGTASFGGQGVTLAFNGGSTAATFADVGALEVTGDVVYGVAAEASAALGEQGLYQKTLFTGVTALADGTRERLEAGIVPGLGKMRVIKSVTFEDGAVTLRLSRSGAVFFIR